MKIIQLFLSFFLIFFTSLSLFAKVKYGQLCPDFTLQDSHGQTQSLSQYKGKFVVLEWVNYDCPFVKKHYSSRHMQYLQKHFREKGVVWLSINSSGKGKQGFFPNTEINRRIGRLKADVTAYLIDESGKIGHLYSAHTTPHIFIIDKEGKLIYQGAIDDDSSIWGSDPYKANNYVRIVLDAVLSGKPVPVKQMRSYGCSVKYKN